MMRQHPYGHAPNASHPAAHVVESYGVYHDSHQPTVNYHDPQYDRYHDTHITYTDSRSIERPKYNEHGDGYSTQRAHVSRAGVVVNASGNSSIVRGSASAQDNNTAATAQVAQNVHGNAQQAQNWNETDEVEGGLCCACQDQRKVPNTTTNTSDGRTSLWAIWCRPTILLLMLVLVASIFVLASGIMLYYHCTYLWML
ncbi:hypothetical protein GWI33_019716 [Rhynchophorus ferrugineus]|uniref:Uncharacterized protein n=1 Tax=Rhynchophorus ferrugineus TaxID=354439 RepID=A0A834HXR4_RHYFE|nr:hypothetical protein GWI33_019716 [Rhynchophorus ferrugineus]